MTLAQAFAGIAAGFSTALGGPYVDAVVLSRGKAEYDAGGDVIPNTGTPAQRACKAQFDACTEAMRAADGYTAKDMRILVLAASLTGDLGTDDRLRIASGRYAGTWLVQSVGMDPGGIGWELRGRRG